MNPTMILNDRYKIIKKIGFGSFGIIYSAMDTEIGCHKVAIKTINRDQYTIHKNDQFIIECRMYELLQRNNHNGFAKFYACQQSSNYSNGRHFLVIELLYKNLKQLFQMCNFSFSMKTILYIAIQAITRIEMIHKNDYIYRDIKPENFMIGFPGTINARTIHLIDFGLIKQYRRPDTKEHIPKSKKAKMIGSILFMSCNSHFHLEQSRRDDLESLAYMLLYFLKRKNLPWSFHIELAHNNFIEKFRNIGLMKQALNSEHMFKGYPIEFAEFLSYARNLEFEEEPNYEMLRSKFVALFYKLKLKDDGIFDWEYNPNYK